MTKSLIILETIAEAKYFVGSLKTKFGELAVLSLQPNISAYLSKHNIKSIGLADVFDTQSHHLVMGKCKRLETYLKNELKKQMVASPEKYFEDTFFHYLRLIWRHFLWNIEVLAQVLGAGNYKQVVAFQYDKIVTRSPWIEDEQLFMGDLAELFCRKNKLKFERLSLPGWQGAQSFKREKKPVWYSRLCNWISYYLTAISTSILAKKKTLLVPSFAYDMNLICDELRAKDNQLKVGTFYPGKEGIAEIVHAAAVLLRLMLGRKNNIPYPVDFVFPVMTFARFREEAYHNDNEKGFMLKIMERLDNCDEKLTIFKGIDIFSLLQNKVVADLVPYMLKLHFQAYGLEIALQKIRPNYVISQMNFGLNGALGTFAKKLNIPSVLISHGSHVLHEDKYAAREHEIMAGMLLVGDYTYSAVQSPYAYELASRMIDQDRLVRIKPSLWGRSVNNKRRDKNGRLTIVHAGSFKLRHNRWYIYENSDEFLQELQDLCEIAAQLPELRLILRLRPDIYELSSEAIKELLPLAENISIKSDGSFLDILKGTDLLISFSSTTIEEALNNKIPVLQYGGGGRYCHLPCQPFSQDKEVSRAVAWVRNKEELRDHLIALAKQAANFSVPDQEFKRHVFADAQAVDFVNWFSKLMKNEVK